MKLRILTTAFMQLLGVFSLLAQVTVGTMTVGQGVSDPSDWRDYFSSGIYIDVNTSACGFTRTPHYLVTLESIGGSIQGMWQTSGLPAVYNATPTGFRVYIRWTDHPTVAPTIGGSMTPNPLRASFAQSQNWVIRWTAIASDACTSKRIPIKVMLQGAYNGLDMNKTLNDVGTIPLSQPYNVSPYNYTGTESVDNIPADVVDWVLIQLRAPSDDSSIIAQRAAFVKTDGTVVDIDGFDGVLFSNLGVSSGFISVQHRNHLGVMTNSVVPF